MFQRDVIGYSICSRSCTVLLEQGAGYPLFNEDIRAYLTQTGVPIYDAKSALTKPRIDAVAAITSLSGNNIPVINSVTVDANYGCLGNQDSQWVMLNGERFLASASVYLDDGVTIQQIPQNRMQYTNANQISVCAALSSSALWSARVENPVFHSNWYSFEVNQIVPTITNVNPPSLTGLPLPKRQTLTIVGTGF